MSILMQQPVDRRLGMVRIRKWTERVWAKAEAKWLARNGQDSFYSDHVVVPGLAQSIQQLCPPGPVELLDLGCGDGYATEGLVKKMIAVGLRPSRVFLLDRSEVQLEIACRRPGLMKAMPIPCDLNDCEWAAPVPPRRCRRIVVSTFAIQELPALTPLLSGLKVLTLPEDLILVLTVAPMFSASLLRRGEIREPVQGSVRDDWMWRGLYPIDGSGGRAYLPHFQRTIKAYRRILCKRVFQCVDTSYHAVPEGHAANRVFLDTVYGRDIVGVHSSVILALRRVAFNIRGSYD